MGEGAIVGKRASLTDFAARKPQPAEETPTPPVPGAVEQQVKAEKAEERKGQTLRLTPAAWRQLKQLALDREARAHELLVEAVNDLFRKHGKPPIA